MRANLYLNSKLIERTKSSDEGEKRKKKGKRRNVPRCAMSCTFILGSLSPRLSSPELCKISDPFPHVTIDATREIRHRSLLVSKSGERNQKERCASYIDLAWGYARTSFAPRESTAVSKRKCCGRESTFLSSFRILLVFNDRPMG